MVSIFKDFQAIEQYLVKGNMSTSHSVHGLEHSATSFKYHQTCIDQLSTMIRDVCYSSSSLLYSKVRPFTC